MTTKEHIKTGLDTFIQTELLDEPHPNLADEPDLLTTNVIDSLGWMRVVDFVETKYQYRIPPEDITIENFLNLDKLANFITERMDSEENA